MTTRKRFRFLERQRPTRRPAHGRRAERPILKDAADIAALQRAGHLVAQAFDLLGDAVRPGARLDALDALVEAFIREHGAEPLYKGYRGTPPTHPPFPGVICASVNHEICHGTPRPLALAEGDIVGIDIGLKLDGFCGDACVTFPVGRISAEAERLLAVARECLYRGIDAARAGHRLYDIGHAVQSHAEAHGYSVVREWGGHGIGRRLHEAPSVPHTGERENDLVLRPGMVFTIEPMINAGGAACQLTGDGWTVVTADGSLSAQFEHTIAIAPEGPLILSQ
ncbi:type I methionyl aminopeptidase [bacterium]|nr:type I methionyl aminopeptidase [Chloroflexi bacterium CFX6]RIL08315.1 MAG: type I methionyl aminopeptidase [bacterium]